MNITPGEATVFFLVFYIGGVALLTYLGRNDEVTGE